MANIQEALDLAREKVYKEAVTKEDTEIVNVLEALLAECRGGGITGKTFSNFTLDELTSMAGELAAYKGSLNRMIAKAARMKGFYELILAGREKALLKPTIDLLEKRVGKKYVSGTAIKISMKHSTVNTKAKILYLESLHEEYLYLWRAANHMIDAISYRCNFLLSDRADNRYGDDGTNFDLAKVNEQMEKEETEAIELAKKD